MLLTIKDLKVMVGGRVVLNKVSVEVERGEIVGVMGPNGGGKTSLAQTLMGSGQYRVEGGRVKFDRRDLLSMTVDERARAGLYVAWQAPVAIPGISVFTLCKTSYESRGNKIKTVVEFKENLEAMAERVGLTKEHIGRSVNEGFSGGERKRLELLLMLLLSPKLVILDEIDSGLDEVGRAMIVEIIKELRNKGTAFIVISHYKQLLSQIKVDRTLEMAHGRIQARV